MEVDILVAEVGKNPGEDQMFHVNYDGTITDEKDYSVLGGDADAISQRLESTWHEGLSLGEALQVAVKALAGPDRTLAAGDLEVGVLARSNGRRAFRRFTDAELADLLGQSAPSSDGGFPPPPPQAG
jgi:proteasome alpha subunit